MDKVKQKSREVKLRQWTEIITSCRNSGMNIRAWCNENGINEKQYYYWQRKLREMALANVENNVSDTSSLNATQRFAKVENILPSSKNMTPSTAIEVGGAKVEVYADADIDVIEASLKAVLRLC